jgi:DASH complex subunit ASK1
LGEGDFEPPKLSEASRAATERLRPSEEEGSGRKAWENVESPFEKLKREVDRGAATPRKAGGSKLATQVLRNQHEQSRSARKVQATPRRGGTATANPFALNGMDIQSAKQVDRWNGIADLRKTPLAKVKGGILKGKQTAMQNTVDDSIGSLDWPPGMSPPVTMQFSVPQKKYMKTPAKAAAQLAVDDLLRTIEGASPATRRNLIQRIGADSHSLRGTGSPVNLTSTPLKRGPLKGRKSLPTPPTVTKRIGGTAKLTRGVQDTQSPATSSSARLLDEDEDGIDPDEDDDLGTGLSKLGLTQTSAGIDKLLQGGTEDDEDSEEEDESDSDDEEAMPASSQIPTVRANKNGSDYPTGSSLASNSRSIDQDTLFGIRDPNKVSAPSSSALKHSAKFSSSSDAPTQSSSSVNNGSSSGQYQPINHKLYEQGTVYGGRPLLNDDREDTYSAPSPTPATTSMGRRSK